MTKNHLHCEKIMESNRQHLVQEDVRAQFLMQNTLNCVFQQLERIERMEGNSRELEMERCEVGDRNHTTPEDNYSALRTKLMAFSAMHNEFRGVFKNSAENRLREWIERRHSKDQCSKQFTQALVDTWKACQGRYTPKVVPVVMTEEMLQNYSQRLAEAAHDFHRKEDEFLEDPEAAVVKPEMYKIQANESLAEDATGIREVFENLAKDPEPVKSEISIGKRIKNIFTSAVKPVTDFFKSKHDSKKDHSAQESEQEDPDG